MSVELEQPRPEVAWQTMPLGDVCGFQNGFAFKSSKFRDSGTPILRISNIQDDKIDTRKIVFTDPTDYRENLDRYLIGKGALLIAMSGATTGKIGINTSNTTFLLNQRVGKFEPTERLNKKFLYYFLSTKVAANLKMAAGAAQPNLSTQQIKEFAIPVPPLPKQERIVTILDEAFAGIATATAHAERNLNNARELFQSVLQSTFEQKGEDWVETKLGEVCENLDSRRVPITKNKRVPGEYPYYGASGVVDEVDDYIFDEDLLLVSEDGANLLARTYPIAFSVSGKIWVNNHAHVLRFPTIEAQRLMEFYLNSIKLDPFISGMAQLKLNQKSLNGIPVPAPPHEAQKAIVHNLDALATETRRLERVYQRKLDALAELKQSLLHRAFAGEL